VILSKYRQRSEMFLPFIMQALLHFAGGEKALGLLTKPV
jgi:hypothetical protein